MQNEFISRETFWIAGLLPAFFAGQVSTQLRCSRALIIHNFRTSCFVVHYLHSPYNPEFVLAHSGLHGSLPAKKDRHIRFCAHDGLLSIINY